MTSADNRSDRLDAAVWRVLLSMVWVVLIFVTICGGLVAISAAQCGDSRDPWCGSGPILFAFIGVLLGGTILGILALTYLVLWARKATIGPRRVSREDPLATSQGSAVNVGATFSGVVVLAVLYQVLQFTVTGSPPGGYLGAWSFAALVAIAGLLFLVLMGLLWSYQRSKRQPSHL